MIESIASGGAATSSQARSSAGSATRASHQCRIPLTVRRAPGRARWGGRRARPSAGTATGPRPRAGLPAAQQRGRHLAGRGRLVELGQAAVAVLVGVVRRAGRRSPRDGGSSWTAARARPRSAASPGPGAGCRRRAARRRSRGARRRARPRAGGRTRRRGDGERQHAALDLGGEHASSSASASRAAPAVGAAGRAHDPAGAVGVRHDGRVVVARARRAPDARRRGPGRRPSRARRGRAGIEAPAHGSRCRGAVPGSRSACLARGVRSAGFGRAQARAPTGTVTGVIVPDHLPLSRAVVDRAARRRTDDGFVAAALSDDTTRVLLVLRGAVGTAGGSLSRLRPSRSGARAGRRRWLVLGRGETGESYLASCGSRTAERRHGWARRRPVHAAPASAAATSSRRVGLVGAARGRREAAAPTRDSPPRPSRWRRGTRRTSAARAAGRRPCRAGRLDRVCVDDGSSTTRAPTRR